MEKGIWCLLYFGIYFHEGRYLRSNGVVGVRFMWIEVYHLDVFEKVLTASKE